MRRRRAEAGVTPQARHAARYRLSLAEPPASSSPAGKRASGTVSPRAPTKPQRPPRCRCSYTATAGTRARPGPRPRPLPRPLPPRTGRTNPASPWTHPGETALGAQAAANPGRRGPLPPHRSSPRPRRSRCPPTPPPSPAPAPPRCCHGDGAGRGRGGAGRCCEGRGGAEEGRCCVAKGRCCAAKGCRGGAWRRRGVGRGDAAEGRGGAAAGSAGSAGGPQSPAGCHDGPGAVRPVRRPARLQDGEVRADAEPAGRAAAPPAPARRAGLPLRVGRSPPAEANPAARPRGPGPPSRRLWGGRGSPQRRPPPLTGGCCWCRRATRTPTQPPAPPLSPS